MSSTRYNPETRIFESDLMESMTRTHPAGPAIFWIPAVVVFSVYAFWQGISVLAYVPLFLVGALAWTLFEYCLHRWVMHWVPPIPAVRKYYYLVHQVHHDLAEPDRLVAPVPMAIVISLPLLAGLYLALGPVWMWAFFAGFVVGYLAYDYLHFYSHFGKPTSRIMKTIRRRHLQHHALHDRWFGVSVHLWDYAFGTHVKAGERRRPDDEMANADWQRALRPTRRDVEAH
jgi:dihydroceramide fatty acyl 2-hydroxylase